MKALEHVFWLIIFLLIEVFVIEKFLKIKEKIKRKIKPLLFYFLVVACYALISYASEVFKYTFLDSVIFRQFSLSAFIFFMMSDIHHKEYK